MNKRSFIVGFCTAIELVGVTYLTSEAVKYNRKYRETFHDLIDETFENAKLKFECGVKDRKIKNLEKEIEAFHSSI